MDEKRAASLCLIRSSPERCETLPPHPGCNFLCGCPACPLDVANDCPDSQQETVVILPAYSTREVYQDYVADFNRGKMSDEEMPYCYTSFRKLWKTRHPNFKVARTKTGWAVCDQYTHWRAMMSSATTVADRQKYFESYELHLQQQRQQRLRYYHHRRKALKFPDKYLSMIMDAMDQAKCDLPHVMRQSKSSEKQQKLKHKLMAAMVHGVGTYVYVAPTPVATHWNWGWGDWLLQLHQL